MSESRCRPGVRRNDQQADVVRQMADLYLRGKGLQAICDWLRSQGIPTPRVARVWHPAVVQRILRNPLHAGLIEHEGEHIRGAHYSQRVYDEDVFHQIMEQMKRRSRVPRRTLFCSRAPLASLARCDECGSRMHVVPISDRYRAYRCDGPRIWGTDCSSRPYVRGDFLEPRIAQEIEKVATDSQVLALAEREAKQLLSRESAGRGDEVKRLLAERAQVERRWVELGEAFGDGSVSKDMLRACDQELGMTCSPKPVPPGV